MPKVEIPEHLRTDEWRRLPKPPGRIMELSRTTLLEIIQNPQSDVKSAVIRKPGRTRGVRLIYMPSLFDYLAKLAGLEDEKSNSL